MAEQKRYCVHHTRSNEVDIVEDSTAVEGSSRGPADSSQIPVVVAVEHHTLAPLVDKTADSAVVTNTVVDKVAFVGAAENIAALAACLDIQHKEGRPLAAWLDMQHTEGLPVDGKDKHQVASLGQQALRCIQYHHMVGRALPFHWRLDQTVVPLYRASSAKVPAASWHHTRVFLDQWPLWWGHWMEQEPLWIDHRLLTGEFG